MQGGNNTLVILSSFPAMLFSYSFLKAKFTTSIKTLTIRVITTQTNLVLDCVLDGEMFIPFSPHSYKQWN